MGLYITDMEMPKDKEVFLRIDEKGEVYVYGSYPTKLHKAVPVPAHGRLIDADALEELVIKQKYACAGASAHGAISELHKSWGLHDAELMIEAAPTIIPAEPN